LREKRSKGHRGEVQHTSYDGKYRNIVEKIFQARHAY